VTEPLFFERVAIVGVGLIGSSLALAMKRHGLAGHIVGSARSQATRDTALELGLVDSVAETGDAADGADLVVVATPVGAYAAVAAAIGPRLKEGAIVTDAGSVKGMVAPTFAPHLPAGVQLVPGHPVAGTENSGPAAGFAELFEHRFVILTPPADADPAAVAKVRALWERVGSAVEVMDARHHDKVLAITSHLPHLIAYTIVGTVTDLEDQLSGEAAANGDSVTQTEVIKYSAGGFRDFTRIAGSDPVMWRDVFLNNKEAVLEMLGRFTEDLTALQRAVRWGEGETLEAWFTRTRAIRRGIVEAGQAGTFRATEPEDG